MGKTISSRYKKFINETRGAYVRSQKNVVAQRRARMIIQGVVNLALAALGIYFAWWEFGLEVFKSKIFWVIFVVWAYFSITLFLEKWESAERKTTDEKIDTLIKSVGTLVKEIRRDRNERKNKGN